MIRVSGSFGYLQQLQKRPSQAKVAQRIQWLLRVYSGQKRGNQISTHIFRLLPRHSSFQPDFLPRILLNTYLPPSGSVCKESTCNARDPGLIPGSRRFPGEKKNGTPLQCSGLENLMERGAWQAIVHRVRRVKHDLVTKPPIHPLVGLCF